MPIGRVKLRHTSSMLALLAAWLCCFSFLHVVSGSAASCHLFPWSMAASDAALSSFCLSNGTSQVAACSLLLNGCENASPDVCNSTRILSTLCTDKPDADVCSRLLKEYSNNTGPACLRGVALPLPSSSSIQQDAQQLCSSDNSLPGCETCSAASCSNPLGTLVQACPSSSNSASCTGFSQFCNAVTPAKLPSICQAPVSSVPLCGRQNSRPECSSYQYPDALALEDVKELCASMPDMTACTLYSLCQSGAAKGPGCKPFTLLGLACTDMPTMAPCDNHQKMCAAGSVVKQCRQDVLGSPLPGTSQTRSAILSSCASHFMPSCHTCTADLKVNACPDPLTTLSKLCQEHPSMAACQLLYNLCQGTTRSTFRTLCPSGGSVEVLPSMMQYLHQRVGEVVLFQQWVPRTPGAYAATLLAIVGFGILSQFLKTMRSVLDAKWMVKSWHKNSSQAAQAQTGSLLAVCCMSLLNRKQLKRNVVRTLLTGVILTLDYCNMLILMTFNVGMFVAVIFGYCVGTFLFSHVVEVLRIHSSQPLDDTAFYENGAASLIARDLGEEAVERVASKGDAVLVTGVDACGCNGVSSETVQQVAVQMSVVKTCENCG